MESTSCTNTWRGYFLLVALIIFFSVLTKSNCQGQSKCDKCNIPIDKGGCKCDSNCDCKSPSLTDLTKCDKCNIPVENGGCKCDNNCDCKTLQGSPPLSPPRSPPPPLAPEPGPSPPLPPPPTAKSPRSTDQGNCDKCSIPIEGGGCECDDNCNCKTLQGSPSLSPPRSPPLPLAPGPGPSPPLPPPSTAKRKFFPWQVVGSTGALAFLMALALSCCFLYRPRWKRLREPLPAYIEPEEFDGLKVYSYSKLENATSQFADKLGGGGSAHVFRGVLDGKVVAVKRLKELEERRSSELEFRREAKGLGLLQHMNLVRLLGYSAEHARPKMLVYEFVPGGSLDSLLYGARSANFSLQRRMEIALGIARGIEYCHHSIEAPLIHRDLKPANILMTSADDNGIPKIADFGLAKLAPQPDSEQAGGGTIVDMVTVKVESSSSCSSGATSGATSGAQTSDCPLPLTPAGNTHTTYVAGTHGYIDPEYLHTGVATLKSDVYSFGMVVLELLLGSSPMYIFAELSAGKPPCVWLAELVSKGEWEAAKLVGTTLGQEITDIQGCFQLLNIVLECLQEKGQDRPTMRNVATRLDSDHAV